MKVDQIQGLETPTGPSERLVFESNYTEVSKGQIGNDLLRRRALAT